MKDGRKKKLVDSSRAQGFLKNQQQKSASANTIQKTK